MTRQAIQLGWLPRLRVTQTSSKGYGQIYVGVVNWLLMFATVGLTIGFGQSENLASAYGVAVSATMLMTSKLLFIAMRELWNWSLLQAGFVVGLFVVIDTQIFQSLWKVAMYLLFFQSLSVALCIYGIRGTGSFYTAKR